jgi:hypothetical protein
MRPTTAVLPVTYSLLGRLPRATLSLAVVATLAGGGAGCDSTSVTVHGAGGASGAGGANGAGGSGVVAAIGCTDPDPATIDYIDNMEDGDNVILSRDGRLGYWYTYHDKTSGTLNPDQDVNVVMELIPGGRCGATTSTHAMRVTGSGFTDWGSAFAFSLKYQGKELPYDASRFTGVTFWARVGETSVDTIRFAIGDQWSRPDAGNCTTTPSNGPMACYDTFGSTVTLGKSWERHSVLFGQMEQRSFGLQRPALDETTLMTVEFAIDPGAPVFDIWVDDVAFF